MLHRIATVNQNNLKVILTYFEPGIRTIPQPPPALGCKTWWKPHMSLPSLNFPLVSLDAIGSLRISTPQITRIFLFTQGVCSAPCCPHPSWGIAQNFHCYTNNIWTTKIKAPKTGKSRSGISQKLHNFLVMTPWKKYVLLLVNHTLPAS